MTRILPVRFQGTFTGINTYTLDAAQRPGGIASEELERIVQKARKEFRPQGVNIICNPFNSPASIQTTGNPEAVQEADAFVRTRLSENRPQPVEHSYTE